MNAFIRLPSSMGQLSVPWLIMSCTALVVLSVQAAEGKCGLGSDFILVLALLGAIAGAPSSHAVTVRVESDTEGNPRIFALFRGNERTALEPGRTWVQVDHFKWVTRGVME